MVDSDWRSLLTASERYENIQKLTNVVAGSGQSAFAIENEAYKSTNSKDEYDAACDPSTVTAEAAETVPPPAPENEDNDTDTEPGITIGPYKNCHYVASGVTAEVYRSNTVALKVIVETHNIDPHNPQREAKILASLRTAPNIIPLLSTFHDQNQRFVLAFPYMPLTLSHLLDSSPTALATPLLRTIFTSLFRALAHLHSQNIIHRDIKPSAILLPSPTNPSPSQIYLSDFGTAWSPTLSPSDEPPASKILDVGTGPYRAPETLFGNRAYGTAIDLWAAGAMLAECVTRPRPKTLFESRAAHEDGNQLGLILSIFKTVGSPTRESWPEAEGWRTPPWGMYRVFEGRLAQEEGGWRGLLGLDGDGDGDGEGWVDLVGGLVRYESGRRVTAEEALEFPCLKGDGGEP